MLLLRRTKREGKYSWRVNSIRDDREVARMSRISVSKLQSTLETSNGITREQDNKGQTYWIVIRENPKPLSSSRDALALMPDGTYVRGTIRRLGQELGIEPSKIVKQIMERGSCQMRKATIFLWPSNT